MGVLARRVRPEDWTPIGVEQLEANAMSVVCSTENRSVIAGPGAGKTELLAQRAAYLLQTGASPTPQRILAISFKRDAASNLGARVRKRCHRQHAGRFDSMTFDAFAKGLLDRFGQVLPKRWRPTQDYEVMFPNERRYRNFLESLGAPPKSVGNYADIMALTITKFEREHLLGTALPGNGWPEPSLGGWAAGQYWQASLHGGKTSRLSFPMIGRIVELLLRLNPMARDALRLTYSHLFMDEFQDTTQIQYDLVRTIFLGADTIVTAVGDNKQQIMRWAMAMNDPFAAFDADFKPKRTPLRNNYRSSPELVRIQHILARALDVKSVKPVSMATGIVAGESCAIWDFPSPEREADRLAEFVALEMKEHDLGPRDFVLLVRQKAGRIRGCIATRICRCGHSAAERGRAGGRDHAAGASRRGSVRIDHRSTTTCDDCPRRAALDGVPGGAWRASWHRYGRRSRTGALRESTGHLCNVSCPGLSNAADGTTGSPKVGRGRAGVHRSWATRRSARGLRSRRLAGERACVHGDPPCSISGGYGGLDGRARCLRGASRNPVDGRFTRARGSNIIRSFSLAWTMVPGGASPPMRLREQLGSSSHSLAQNSAYYLLTVPDAELARRLLRYTTYLNKQA